MPGLLAFAVLLFAYCAISMRLGRWSLSAPMVFVGLGALFGFSDPGLGSQYLDWIGSVAEVALAILLFHDAAQARPEEFSKDAGLVARLLLIGLPLTILLGYGLGAVMFPQLDWAFLLLLAAALAPTDAGLGAATVLNPVVPLRVRRVLNMESGLNDGLATPVVLFAIAVLAGQEGLAPRESFSEALVEIAIGIGIGVAVGVIGGTLLGISRRRNASDLTARELAVLALPIIAYLGAGEVHGNGFIAAFVAGSAMAGAARWLTSEHAAMEFTEAVSEPLGFLVWLVFGLVAVPFVWGQAGLKELAFAVASLTVLRMLPVAISLIGTGLGRPAVGFIGWFGPRGLASVIFSLLALDALQADAALRTVLATISLTILISVVAHGVTAGILADRFGAWAADHPAGLISPPAADATDLSGADSDSGAGEEPRPRGWRRFVVVDPEIGVKVGQPPRTGRN